MTVNFDHRFTKISRTSSRMSRHCFLNRKGLLFITNGCLLLGLRAHRSTAQLGLRFSDCPYFLAAENGYPQQLEPPIQSICIYICTVYTHFKNHASNNRTPFFWGGGCCPLLNLNFSNHSHEAPEIPSLF